MMGRIRKSVAIKRIPRVRVRLLHSTQQRSANPRCSQDFAARSVIEELTLLRDPVAFEERGYGIVFPIDL